MVGSDQQWREVDQDRTNSGVIGPTVVGGGKIWKDLCEEVFGLSARRVSLPERAARCTEYLTFGSLVLWRSLIIISLYFWAAMKIADILYLYGGSWYYGSAAVGWFV